MPRAATVSDVFNAIAEPRRREIIDFLAIGPRRAAAGRGGPRRAVGELEKLGIAQPSLSKHLGVLRRVGALREKVES
jgi:DNA-binding transcriptional ArsR family regulator